MVDPMTATAPWWAPVAAKAVTGMGSSVMPAAIGAAGALGQGLVSSAFNLFQADKNRDWQERMSNTAHQREVQDLMKAGLNPMLSIRHGGASTPSGNAAQASMPEGAVSSAVQAATMRGQLQLQQAQVRDINAAAALKEVQARVSSATEAQQIQQVKEAVRKLALDGDISWHTVDKIDQEIKNLRLEGTHSAYGLSEAGARSRFYQGVGGKLAPWLDSILRHIPLKGR